MQTDVLSRLFPAIEGMLADNGDKDATSCVNGEGSAEIPFGVMVKHGAADFEVLKMTATTNKLAGIAMFNQAYAKPQELGDVGIKPNMAFNILNEGRIWVRVEDAVTPASPVHVRAVTGGTNGYGAGGAETAGAFRGSADSTDTMNISSFARFKSSAGAGEFAVLEIDMTGAATATADS